jgi:hypothetical protein
VTGVALNCDDSSHALVVDKFFRTGVKSSARNRCFGQQRFSINDCGCRAPVTSH